LVFGDLLGFFFLWSALVIPVYLGEPYSFFIKFITFKKKTIKSFGKVAPAVQ
jgi:hypothetical protein